MSDQPSEKISVSVVLPAYKEEGGIGDVVAGLHKIFKEDGRNYEVIVVDDGSGDRTGALAEEAGAKVLTHPTNVGYGKSLLTGFAAAQHDWVLMLDADGSYPPEDALKLLPHAPAFDMIVGARQGSLFWGSPLKAFLRTVYLRLASFVAGVKIPDANSGLRLLRKDAVKAMPILCYGYSLSTTMTLSFLQGGLFVKFVPVSYAARKGSSKVRPIRDILRTLQIMIQVILYYNPLKFAVYLALIPLLLTLPYLGFMAYSLWLAPNIGGPDIFMALLPAWEYFRGALLTALAVFLAGCFLEVQKLNRGR
jgi:glycosyltransferase involved in cell wall biosynthesis